MYRTPAPTSGALLATLLGAPWKPIRKSGEMPDLGPVLFGYALSWLLVSNRSHRQYPSHGTRHYLDQSL
jgi:hypothetical protein